MIHYNEIKANVRGVYETLKKLMPFPQAISTSINSFLSSIPVEQILHPSRTFSSIEEVVDLLNEELSEEVNIIVEDGEQHTIFDNKDHIEWYKQKKAEDAINFRFWPRYKKYLNHIKGWATSTVENLDKTTDGIIELFEDPTVKNRAFDRRGLVVGYVQSGKTASFMGVINKAIDSGYKIIIVLAGMHENLRQQTQERIDEEILGRDTSIKAEIKRIGVSTLPGETYYPIDTFTESNYDARKNGDFNLKKSHGTPPTSDRCIIFVVKKNKSILKNLIKYFKGWIETFDGDLVYEDRDIKQFNNLPLLIVDDEADQASVNTKPHINTDGEEVDPTAINECIRELLQLFRQKIYLAYTATPFANIFIHHDRPHTILGKDLFPESFIKTLDAPSNYFGPKRVFGLNDCEEFGLPINRTISDSGLKESDFVPLKHKADYTPENISESLREAIDSFIISSAIRWFRGQSKKHNTMLIHCTRYTSVQNKIAQLVKEYVEKLSDHIINHDADTIKKLKNLYEKDHLPTTISMYEASHCWNDILPNFSKVIRKLESNCLIINGTVGDILDYANKKETGLWVIAVGGDKLSRGLTLEGLTISYFTRTTSLYDTLMQMGRWFGYRTGFEDLCRIYTTKKLYDWYRNISTAFEVLRAELIEMERLRLTPKEFGLRIISHPDMMITSTMKMRDSIPLRLNYKGTCTETTSFPNNEKVIESNYQCAESLILGLRRPDINEKDKIVWLNRRVSIIEDFLDNYQTYKGLPAANSKRIKQYLETQRAKDITDFDNWNIALITLDNSQKKDRVISFSGHKIRPVSRSLKEEASDKLFIKMMTDKIDEVVDLDTDPRHLSRKQIRKLPGRLSNPLLMIYVLNVTDYGRDDVLQFNKNIVGFAISWSDGGNSVDMQYYVNTVYQELDLNEDEEN
ncbi:Z1 domain-containing protein [Dysgonomonas alginatilytica]|uniref:Z1 domain-containing protein n=1 Tax=Dysgonomonas alginatilytica TaxID=1605892 RepID=A0A2V3PYQ3_9BACT|nr:Z1 domain-containing protein [Dysgonomonas alginatilytica]PXV66922.1 Z1 domain-containing protein [Dysgonomonas alginatilytica]